jgi:hypothetical protein
MQRSIADLFFPLVLFPIVYHRYSSHAYIKSSIIDGKRLGLRERAVSTAIRQNRRKSLLY